MSATRVCGGPEYTTGVLYRLGPDDLAQPTPPLRIGRGTSWWRSTPVRSWAAILALGWPLPAWTLDLYTEFRVFTNGQTLPLWGRPAGGLRGPFGLPIMAAVEKDTMRQLAMRGGPYSPAEQTALLDYCSDDVDATVRLFRRMQPVIDLDRALLRGRYMAAVAAIERVGVPINRPMLRDAPTVVGHDEGDADRGRRSVLPGVRGRHVQARSLRGVSRSPRHPLAADGDRAPGPRRRYLPRPGAGVPDARSPTSPTRSRSPGSRRARRTSSSRARSSRTSAGATRPTRRSAARAGSRSPPVRPRR